MILTEGGEWKKIVTQIQGKIAIFGTSAGTVPISVTMYAPTPQILILMEGTSFVQPRPLTVGPKISPSIQLMIQACLLVHGLTQVMSVFTE